MRDIFKRSLPAIFVSAGFLLSACSSGSSPSMPFASNQAPAGVRSGEGPTALGVRPDATCPKKFTAGCFTFSLAKGLKIAWCYGPTSDQCEDTKDYSWNGDVCLAKAKKCGTIPQMTAKWTGPFKCTKAACKGSKGTYEEDTISKGKTPPKVTTKYIYKQQINVCAGSSCGTYYIGINVSK